MVRSSVSIGWRRASHAEYLAAHPLPKSDISSAMACLDGRQEHTNSTQEGSKQGTGRASGHQQARYALLEAPGRP